MSADVKEKQNKGAAAQNIADVLYSVGILSDTDYNSVSIEDNEKIENYLRNNLKISEEIILKAYSVFYNLPIVALDLVNISPEALSFLSKEQLQKYEIIPYNFQNNQLDIAVANPKRLQSSAPGILTELMTKHNIKISLALLPKVRFKKILDNYEKITQKANQVQLQNNPLKKIFEQIKEQESQQKNEPPQKQPWLESKIPFIDLTNRDIPLPVITRFPEELAKKYQMVVFDAFPYKEYKKPPKMIKVALVNPSDPQVRNILNFVKTKNNIEIEEFVTSPTSLSSALSCYHKNPKLVIKKTPVIQDAPKEIIPTPPRQTLQQGNERELKKQGLSASNTLKELKTVADLPEKNIISKQNPVLPTRPLEPYPLAPQTVPAQSAQTKEGDKILDRKIKFENKQQPVQPQSNISQAIQKPKPIASVKTTLPASKDVIVVSPSEVQLRPEGSEENQTVQNNMENTNLDKFLNGIVNSPKLLSDAFVSGLVPQIVASTISYAIEIKASDIHIEPQENYLRIRYRVDGELKEVIRVPMFLHAAIVSRIKILSKLKIDEQRIPQDGRFDVQVSGHKIDLRISSLPTVYGEKIVMRVLDKSTGIYTLEQLGVTGSSFDSLVENIKKPYGIILATGPTGSGKSTTLYAILQRLSKPGVNIITLEDPVEYELEGINQCQVKPKIGFTFAEGLRSVLRQDPNIIMVGEIRDLETASLATHAALTGHLVLSTLHTNDASGALPRLINMGVEPFLITSSINAVMAQRLVRKICPFCKEEYPLPAKVKEEIKDEIAQLSNIKVAQFDETQLKFYHGKGCSQCSNGYKGRIGIYEVLSMTEEIEDLAVRKAPSSEIAKRAIAQGMLTMKQDGILKALKGVTTIDEVLRVTMSS